MKSTKVCLIVASILLTGCGGRLNAVFDDPGLSPVGSGLSDNLETASIQSLQESAGAAGQGWKGGPADYFRDSRAQNVGDIVTVLIDMNDRASFNNSSTRSRNSKTGIDTEFDVGLMGLFAAGKGGGDASGSSSASGQGSVVRSEKLSISVSALVRDVLPNGFLFIEGTQEILVNSEMRKIKVSGIVDPRHVSAGNRIAYSRIAEARILYGGKGKVSDIQKPRWGLQLWDKISPF